MSWLPVLAVLVAAALIGLSVDGRPDSARQARLLGTPVLQLALTLTTWRLVRLPGLGDAERRVWRTMLLAFAVLLASGAAQSVGHWVPVPWFDPGRNVAVAVALVVMTAALFRFPAAPRRRLPRARFVLDGVTIFAATAVYVWSLVLAPQLAAGAIDVRLAILVLLVVGCLAVLAVALSLLLLAERAAGTRAALQRLIVAVAIVLGLILVVINRGLDPAAPPPLWQLGLNWTALLLVMSAAEQQRRHVLRPAGLPNAAAPPLSALPYLAVSAVVGLLLWVGVRHSAPELQGLLVGSAVVGAAVLVRQYLLLRENEALRRRLERQVRHDSLTGLPNRATWEEEAEREVAKALRHARSVAVLVLDVDEFKAVNDTNGHRAGDFALRAVADCLRASLRASDLAARMGGDEFFVLLPDTGLDDAAHLAEALSMRLARTRVQYGNVVVRLTVSVGVAALPPARDLRELVADADEAMYRAKRDGRNRVEVARARPRPVPQLVRGVGDRWG